MLIMLLAIVPLLPGPWRPWGLATLVAAGSLPSSLSSVVFMSSWGEMFRPAFLARMAGRRWATTNIVIMVSSLLLGRPIDVFPFPGNFQSLFLGAGFLGLGSLWFMSQFRLPPRRRQRAPEAAFLPRPTIGAIVREMAVHRPFFLLQAGILLGNSAINAASPVLRVYWVRDPSATGMWVGALPAAYAVGMTGGNVMWGQWSRPDHYRRLALIATLGHMFAYPLLTAASGTLPPLIGVGMLRSFFAGGSDVLVFNRAVQSSPAGQRPTFMSVYALIVSLAGFVGPLIGTMAADLVGPRGGLFVAGSIGLLAALVIYSVGWGGVPPPLRLSRRLA